MSVNKIDYISRDYWNNENDIRSDVEHRIYKRFYNRLISLEQIFENDIIIFDKHRASVDFHENELWLKLLYVMLFEKTFDIN